MTAVSDHPFRADEAHQDFRHEALFYAGEEDFLAGTLPFIRDGVAAGEPILVAVSAAKIRALSAELNGEADRVQFADMAELGKNPARIIPAWREFADQAAEGRPLRGIGEPIWADRSSAELVECQHHEFLLNAAFADTPSFWLLCPYDTGALKPDVVNVAECSHPYIADADARRPSDVYLEPARAPGPFSGELPPPSHRPERLAFDRDRLPAVRSFVSRQAKEAGLDRSRAADLVLAVSELATNSIIHGGGQGTVVLWRDPDALFCEVRDRGRLEHPLLGRERPGSAQSSGRGLWLVNHLCDLVQIRSFPTGNVVRAHMQLS
jgi:anti-sigma regulatory factor (Ser/Thr protein kinase)